jgi:elongation factor G
VEAIAATDDELLERYLGGEEIARADIVRVLKKGLLAGEIVPMLCGSATLTYGMRALLTDMVELLPSPAEVTAPADAPLVARVFKTVSEPHVGDVTFFRLYRGGVKNGQDVWNAQHSVVEKLNHLTVQQGRERIEVPELKEGDIGSVAKLKDTHTNDTFSLAGSPVQLTPIPVPAAVATSAVSVKQRGEEDKLAAGLHKIHEEDPTFHFEYSSELGQTLIHGMGEKHFEIILGRLLRKYGVHAELVRPRVAYRETIKGKAEGQGKHKKQTGGRGQFGDCWVRIAPLPRGSGYRFIDSIVGGVIPNKYIPAVDKGVQEAAARGIIAGYPCVDFQAECYDGSYHDVDSNEMSFKMAGILAWRNVSPRCRPVLLEPLMEVTVWTPDDVLGGVLGDLSGRRGHILGSEVDGRLTRVRAIVPEAELYKYSTTLHSMTHGRGTYRQQFHQYAEAPPEVAAKVAEEHLKDKKESSDD